MARRPKTERPAYEYLPCCFCYSFFGRETLYGHIKNCTLNTHKKLKQVSPTCGLLLVAPYIPKKSFHKDILIKGMDNNSENEGNEKLYHQHFKTDFTTF